MDEYEKKLMEAAKLDNYVGKTIRLIHTDDPYTKLKPGNLGVIRRVWVQGAAPYDIMLDVAWTTGSNLSLVVGKDRYEVYL